MSKHDEIYREIFLYSSLFFIGIYEKFTNSLDNKRMRRNYKMSKQKSMVVGFALGTVVTAAATLLSTPKAGKEVRKDLKVNMDKMKSTFSSIKRDGIQLRAKIRFANKEKEEALQETAASTIEETPEEMDQEIK
ncbi:YtxH domain-containing protein [Fictibacillus phosphorivorans]|nr:YtxH domain-containing protein [Fictibacillus phosphorivorans]